MLSVARPAAAQEEHDLPAHVRPSADLRPLVEEAARRSPIVRALIDRLRDTNIVVYIRSRPFVTTELDGRVALLTTTAHTRYLMIELSCRASTIVQMSTLGHELYHAVEISLEPSIVDARTLAAHYQRIGIERGAGPGRQTFETDAAFYAGQRVRREVLQSRPRSAD